MSYRRIDPERLTVGSRWLSLPTGNVWEVVEVRHAPAEPVRFGVRRVGNVGGALPPDDMPETYWWVAEAFGGMVEQVRAT